MWLKVFNNEGTQFEASEVCNFCAHFLWRRDRHRTDMNRISIDERNRISYRNMWLYVFRISRVLFSNYIKISGTWFTECLSFKRFPAKLNIKVKSLNFYCHTFSKWKLNLSRIISESHYFNPDVPENSLKALNWTFHCH